MTPCYPLLIFSVLHFSLAALGQQIQVTTPSPVIQCASVPIQWSGGVSPFTLTIATTSDANNTIFENFPVKKSSSFTWNEDLPAGTPFTISVTDGNGITGESQPITVQDSTNTSCLNSASIPPPTSTSLTASDTSHIQVSTGTQTSSTETETGSPSPSSLQSFSSSHSSRVPIIAGVVVGVLALLFVIGILIYLQRRKDRRHTTSKDELIRTFGSAKAGLDSTGADGASEMAIPEPYVYKSVTRAQVTNRIPLEAENLRQSSTSTSPSVEPSRTPPSNLAARKGERYLSNNITSPTPEDTTPGGSSQSRIQEEDIDRLAARMVAMMSAGRLSDQAWTPQGGARDARNKDFDVGDDLPAAPPLYNDVTRRTSGAAHASGGRY